MFFGKKKTAVVSGVANENDQTNSLVRRVEASEKLLVWKYEEEKIEMGSTIIVHPSQRVVFIKNGELVGTLEAGEHVMDPDAHPFLKRVLQTITGNKPYIHAQIYYVNETFQMGIPWGCGNIRFMDPMSNIPLNISAYGEMAIQIDPERAAEFVIDLVGTVGTLNQETLVQYFRSKITMIVRSTIAQIIKEMGINLYEISGYLMELAEQLLPKVRVALNKYGVLVKEFIVEDVKLPEDKNFQKMGELYSADYFTTQEAMLKRKEMLLGTGTKTEVAKMEAMGEAEVERIKALSKAELDKIRVSGEAEAAKISAGGEADVAKLHAMGDAEVIKTKADAKAYERNAESYTWQEEMDYRMEEKRLAADVMKANYESQNRQGMPYMMPGGMPSDMGNSNVQFGYYMHAGNGMHPGNVMYPGNNMNQGSWTCTCGAVNTGRFCGECAAPKPNVWVCTCGTQNTGNFCSHCALPRNNGVWVCSCGTQNTGNFCTNCGKDRR